jgi:Leucine-rich repeat (LRR) protein
LEINALHDFYEKLNGNSWRWNEREPWNFSTDPCNTNSPWYGIYCSVNDTTNSSHISAILLSDFNLTGNIRLVDLNLPGLKGLRLSSNSLSGHIPDFANLPNLNDLYLDSNQLTGTIPEFSNLPNLKYLSLYLNQLTGTIPEFSNLPNLSNLYLDCNQLTGILPEFTNLPNLKYLSLYLNQLTGTISDFINFSNLSYIYLDSNELTGTIPEFTNLPNLNQLYLFSNHLTGIIPDFTSLPNLNTLYLDSNQLRGTIPDFTNLPNLTGLYLYSNQLTGPIPDFTSLLNLNTLILDSNQLRGTIPDFTNLPNLTGLSLYLNQLTGTIPDFTNLPNLNFLDLDCNRLSGTISDFTNLPNLLWLDLRSNQLTGTIPEFTNLANLIYLNLSSNILNGSFPKLPSNMTFLALGSNLLTGTVSLEIANLVLLDVSINYLHGSFSNGWLSDVSTLNLASNHFSGSLSLDSLAELKLCNLKGNHFSGNIYQLFNETYQHNLAYIDVSDNRFTGSLPGQYFMLPDLHSFVASKNCFSGSLPFQICHATNLSVLALDGLGNAKQCQHQIFPHTGIHTYHLQKPMTGSIPACIFNMSRIRTFHLSGNGLTGGIPKDLSGNLTNLVLSHNRLRGTLPQELFDRSWTLLDLSSNRISGSLGAFQSEENATILLKENRLSGTIPDCYFVMNSLNLLEGNLFGCIVSNGRAILPSHDPTADSYSCGSRNVNISLIVWTCIGCWIIILRVVLLLPKTLRNQYFPESISMRNYFRHSFRILNNELTDYYELSLKWWNKLSTINDMGNFDLKLSKKIRTKELMNSRNGFRAIRLLASLATTLIISVLLPFYCGLRNYRTHEYSYVWTASLGFLSGHIPAITSLFLIFLVLFVPCFGFLLYCDYENINLGHLKTLHSSLKIIQRTWKSFFVRCSITVFNNCMMLVINIGYVYLLNRQLSTGERTGLQISVAVVKTIWSVGFIKRIFLFLLKLLDAKEADQFGRLQLLSFLNIFNFVVAPLCALAAFDPNCFKYTLFTRADIELFYEWVLETCTRGKCVSSAAFSDVSYSPPFIYNYQCTSTLLDDFITIFVYKYTIGVFLIMAGSLSLLLLLKYRFTSELLTVLFLPKQIHFTVIKLKRNNMLWAPFAKQEEWLMKYLGFLIKDDELSNKCFDGDILIIGLIGDFAILFTFGVAFPPLAVIVCLSIVYQTVFHQVLIGRLLCELEETIEEENKLLVIQQDGMETGLSVEKWTLPEEYLTVLADECQHLWRDFKASIKYLAFFSSAFLSFFLFDILGDDVGLRKAIWIIPVTTTMPFYLFGGYLICKHLLRFQQRGYKTNLIVPVSNEKDDVELVVYEKKAGKEDSSDQEKRMNGIEESCLLSERSEKT